MNGHASLNKIYRLVWSDVRRAWIVAPETARGRTKRNSIVGAAGAPVADREARHGLLGLLAIPLLSFSLGAWAGPAAPAGYSPPATLVAPATLPTNGAVVAGQATITQSGVNMNINQTTTRSVIDWGTYNVGADASVNYTVPTAVSSTLNRVLDSQPSQILGKITSNGQVFLVNPNGIYFGTTASVDVGGLVATTHDIADADYLAGGTTFKRNGATGSVVNEGQIRAALGGYIALLAPEVRNQGVIVAQLGTVALASGESVTLQFDGNHSLAGLIVEPSRIRALVANGGAVVAPGGLIILSAQALDRLQGGVVQNSGSLEATGMAMRGGRIVLSASDAITSTGSITANAGSDGSPAGSVSLTAPAIDNEGLVSATALGGATPLGVAGGSITLGAETFTQGTGGRLDVGGDAGGGALALAASGDISLAGALGADSAAVGGTIVVAAGGNLTLSSASVSAAGDAGGGAIRLGGGGVPTDPTQPVPTLAILGNSTVSSGSRRGAGGSVTLTGAQVGLFDATAVDASGATGGGTIAIGGGLQGQDPAIADAAATYLAPTASVTADATATGAGGRVTIWSDLATHDYGAVSARGGAQGGDGGLVEVSSRGQLDFQGTVDTSAAAGLAGTLLLDPANLTISASADSAVSAATPFAATGTASNLSITTLQNALGSGNVTVQTTNDAYAGAGDLTVSTGFGWFTNSTLTLNAFHNINLNANILAFGGSLTMNAGVGNASGAITVANSSGVNLVSGNLVATAVGGIVESTGASQGTFIIGGTSTFNAGGNLTLGASGNKFTGAVTLTSGSAGSVSLYNSSALVLGAGSLGAGGTTIQAAGTIQGAAAINSTGTVSLTTLAGSNGSIALTGALSSTGGVTLATDGTGSISVPVLSGAITLSNVTSSGAITLGNGSTGALTVSALSGTAPAGGQASGAVALTGASITLNGAVSTKGGNLSLTSTSGSIGSSAAGSITTTANTSTGTASGSVTATAANGLTLQSVTTSGASNASGVGSNAAAVTLIATTGDLNVGAITTSGGAATGATPANRNGGNAGNVTLGATAGTIYLNGNLNAVGGSPVGTATQGLGGYVEIRNPTILTGNRSIDTGATSGDITILSTVNSDTTARTFSLNAGTGSVLFKQALGASAPLSSLTVSSSVNTTVQGSVTTAGAGGVSLAASSTVYLGDNTVAQGSGAITISTVAGNGPVSISDSSTYLQDAVTFTRGTGAINFSEQYLYSTSTERNNLTFDGAGGGAITLGGYIGASSGIGANSLGNILVSTGTDLSINQTISAASLVDLNATGRIYLGYGSYYQYYDGANGLQLQTTGTGGNWANTATAQDIYLYGGVTNSAASAPISVTSVNGAIYENTWSVPLSTNGGAITLAGKTGVNLNTSGSPMTSNGGAINLLSSAGKILFNDNGSTISSGAGLITISGNTGISFNNQNLTIQSTTGNINLTAAAGPIAVTATNYYDYIKSTSGNISLAGVGVQFGDTYYNGTYNYIDAGSGKITIDGGGKQVLIYASLNTTDADSAGTPAILIQNAVSPGAGSPAVLIDSAVAINGTLQIGQLIGGTPNITGDVQQDGTHARTPSLNIHTLGVDATGSITVASTSNTIDQLANVVLGGSLDVEARGRSTGMALAGDITATSVTIKTGTGALAIGARNITSTSGNVVLEGLGVTQSAGSTITSAGTTQILGSDYTQGTAGAVTLAGNLISASTATNSVTIDDATTVQLGNLTAGTVGTRGGLVLGTDTYTYYSGYGNKYETITGNVTQAAGTAIDIGRLTGYQTGGSVNLSAAGNEIGSIGSWYRGGGFLVADADLSHNGLTIAGSLATGSINAPLAIETGGALTVAANVTGSSVVLSGTGIADSGAPTIYSYGGLEFRAHGGALTLGGFEYVNGAGTLQIRNASNVQLGYVSSTGALVFGATGTNGAVAGSQARGAAGNLTLNGSPGFAPGQRVAVASTGNDSGVTFTVTGTDLFGRPQSEVITGANAGSAAGALYFATVTQVATSGATAGTVTVSSATETVTGNVSQVQYIQSATSLSGVVGGSVTLTSSSNSFQSVGNLSAGGDLALYTQYGAPLSVSGAVASTGGNVRLDGLYGLNVTSAGSVATSTAGKGITLQSDYNAGNGGYGVTVQGAVSAATPAGGVSAGVTVNSAGSFSNSATGVISTTGGVTIKASNSNASIAFGGNVTAGASGIRVAAGTTISQSTGVLSTTGAFAGMDASGGSSPSSASPSARGAVTLNGNNTVAFLGPFYLYDGTAGSAAFSFNNTGGSLTLAGAIKTSSGNVTIATTGGILDLASYGVSAGEYATGGANIVLTGRGINQAAGTVNATGSSDGINAANGTGGGTITMTGYDGTAAGAITLGGTLTTPSASGSAITIRGTTALTLPNITLLNGGLVLGTASPATYHITGPITQTLGSALNIKTLTITADSSAVLANTGNRIVQLGALSVGDNAAVQYDLDLYNSYNGLSLTSAITSGGGVRIQTVQGAGASGALAIGGYNITAAGDVWLGGLGVSQTGGTVTAGSVGNIVIDGGGGANNIQMSGTVSATGVGNSITFEKATNATLNIVSAPSGTVALGVAGLAITGSVSQVATTGTINAGTLTGNAGIVTITKSLIDNVGPFTTTGALTLQDQGGAGPAGLRLTGDITVGGASDIETTGGALNLDTHSINASGGAGYDLVLRGVGVTQTGNTSAVKSSTAEIYAGTGSIDLFSTANVFTGQVTLNATGAQARIQGGGPLSLNTLTGKLAVTTSITAWAGTNLVLSPENLTTTTGSIDLRSLNGNLTTPGTLTTGAGSVTLVAQGSGANGNVSVANTITTGSGDVTVTAQQTANLYTGISSTSGNLTVSGATVSHATGSLGSPLALRTGGAGAITVTASGSGGFAMGQYYSYQTASGAITINSGGTADLGNLSSTSGGVIVNAAGNVAQGTGSAIAANSLAVTATHNGTLTLANTGNHVNYLSAASLDASGSAAGSGAIQYYDSGAVAVRAIETAGNATLTARGAILTDSVGGPGTVIANALAAKTLNDGGADIVLTAAGNDVASLTLQTRNATDTANAGSAATTGNIKYTDANGFVVSGIGTGGSVVFTDGAAVTQTGAIVASALGLLGSGSYTLNGATLGIPYNQISTIAAQTTGAINVSSALALAVGAVNPTGITSGGADVTLLAPSITTTGYSIDTRSATAGANGGAVTLTTTGSGAGGNLTLGAVTTSGAAASGSGDGGQAGAMTFTANGASVTVGGVLTARGGAGAGGGNAGANGAVTFRAVNGAVSQANGAGADAINAGKVILTAANASALLDTGNTVDFLAGAISGTGQGFTYRSASDFAVGAGNGVVVGFSTAGGAIDLGGSNVNETVIETVATHGGAFSATGVHSFNSNGVQISTAGNVTLGAAYEDGGAVSVATTAGSGAITMGPILASGDSLAAAAHGGAVTLNASGVLTTGTITSAGSGTGPGGAVGLTGSSVRLGGAVTTAGGSGAAAGGAIAVTGPAIVSLGDLTLNTGAGSGDVTFSSTLDSDAPGTPRSLTINAGSGNIGFTGAVGGTAPLRDVIANASGTTTLGAAFAATSLTTDAAGATHLNGGSVTTTAAQVYNDAVALGGDTLLSGGSVTLASTVDGAHALTVDSAGATTFGGTVGGTTPLTSLTTDAGGTTALNAGQVTTSGAQTYGDAVAIGTDTTLTGSDVDFAGTLDGSHTLLIDAPGVTTFGGAVGSLSRILSLTTTGGGSTAIDGGVVKTSLGQTYDDAVTLGANTVLTGINVEFASTLTSDGTNRGLTVNDAGTTTFGGAVGGSGAAGDRLASLTTDAAGTTALNGATVRTSGAQLYADNLTLGTDAALSGATVTTLGTVTGNGHGLGITGNAVFGNQASDTLTGLSSLAVSGSTGLNTDTVTTTGSQSYGGPVTLGSDATLNAVGVSVGGTLDSDATPRSLTINAGSGTIALTGAVGASHALGTLYLNSSHSGAGAIVASGAVHAASLGVQSAGGVSLENAGNAIGVIAVQLAGDAPLSLVDSTALTIGSVANLAGTSTLVGLTDGTGTSAVSLKVGGLLAQTATGLILMNGTLTIDTSAFSAGNVAVTNARTAGTVVGNTMVAGDYTLDSAGPITQQPNANGAGVDAWLRVGGGFSTPHGQFVESGATTNFFGGGTSSTANPNEIRLNGVITLSMDAQGNLNALDNTGHTAQITAANLQAGGAIVVSDAGGQSITVVPNAQAVSLTQANHIGGALSITTAGTYVNSGTANVTGILESTAIVIPNAKPASFTVQPSAIDATSGVVGAGELLLSNSGNVFGGVTTISAKGLNALIADSVTLNLGDVVAAQFVLIAQAGASQVSGTIIAANQVILGGTGTMTLDQANQISSLAGDVNGALTLNVAGTQPAAGAGTVAIASLTPFNGATAVAGLTTESHALTITTPVGLALNAPLSSGAATTSITATGGEALLLANDASGGSAGLVLSNAMLAEITAAATTFATAGGGNVYVSGATLPASAGAITLASSGSVAIATGAGASGATFADGVVVSAAAGTGTIAMGSLAGATLTATTGDVVLSGDGGVTLASTTVTAGHLTVNGATTLAGPTALVAGLTTVNGTLDGASQGLSISGDAALAGAATNLGSLTVTGATALDGGGVATSGTQSYGGAVTLGADTTLAGTDIRFGGAVDGPVRLTVNGSGATIFTGAVGASAALTRLSTDAAGTTQLNGGAVHTTAGQAYLDNLSLGADTVLTGTSVTTGGTVTGNGHALGIQGDAVFGNAAGDTLSGLTTLGVSGATTINTSAVTTGSTQSYGGPVTLGANTALTGTDVTFASTVDGAFGLAVHASGTATFDGAVGAGSVLASLTTDAGGTTVLNGASVHTSGAQAYLDAVLLGAPATSLTSATGGVHFGATVDSATTGAGALTIDAGAGAISADAALGATTPLAALTVANAAGATFQGAVTAGAVTLANATGTIAFEGLLTAGSLDAGAHAFSVALLGDATVSGATHLLDTGAVTIGSSAASDATFGGGLVLSGPSAVTFAGRIATGDTPLDVAASSPVTLAADTTIATGAGDLAVRGAIDGAYALTLDSQGTTTLGGVLGGTSPLTSLTTDAGGTTVIGGAALAFSGALTFNDAVTVTASTTLTAASVATGSTLLAGTHDLTIQTDALSLGGTVSGSGHLGLAPKTAGATVGVDGGTGSVQLGAGQWDYIAPGFADVTVGNAATGAITLGTAGASVALPNATILRSGAGVVVPADVAIDGAFLRIDAGGASSIAGLLSGTGNLETVGPGVLSLTAAAPNTYTGETLIGTGATLRVVADGALASTAGVLDSGLLDLGDSNGVTTASVIGTGDVILSAQGLTLTAAHGTLSGTVSGASGGIVLQGGALTLAGHNTYAGVTQVTGGTLTVASDTALGDAGAGTTVLAGASLVLDGTAGNLHVAEPIKLAGSGNAIGGALSSIGGDNTLSGGVTLEAGAVRITASAGSLTLQGAVDGPADLTVASPVAVAFQGPIGATTALASLTTDAGGSSSFASVTTSGAQQYGDNVTLNGAYQTGDATFTAAGTTTLAGDTTVATGSGAVTFSGAVDGGHALAVDSSGATSFAGPVGAAAALGSLTTDAGGTTSVGSVRTLGAQQYGDDVTLNGGYQTTNGAFTALGTTTLAGDTMVATGHGAVTFTGAVDGPHGLAVDSSGATTFQADVGAGTALLGLTTDAGGTTSLQNVTTSGAQSYGDAVTLHGSRYATQDADFGIGGAATLANDVTVSTGAGAARFGGTVDGAYALIVDAGGATTFQGAVGGTTALTSLTTDAAGTSSLASVTTSGAQQYGDDVTLNGAYQTGNATFTAAGTTTLAGDTTVATGSGAVTFSGAVDGGHALAVDSSGATSFAGPVGAAAALGSLTTDAGGTTSVGSVRTLGAQQYGDDVTLNGGYQTTNGAFTALGTTTLAGDTMVATGHGAVTFTGAVDGPHGLAVDSSGATTFQADVGAGTALLGLTTDAGGTTSLQNVTTSGAQSYGDAVTLHGSRYATQDADFGIGGAATLANDVTVSTGAGAARFGGTVDGAYALIVDAGGATTFQGAVGGTTALTSLTTDAAGTSSLASVTTSGAQQYGDDVTLNGAYQTGNATFTAAGTTTLAGDTTVATGSGAVTFSGAVDGGHALSVDSSGADVFGAAVGAGQALASVDVTGGSVSLQDVTTTGAQTYSGATTTHSRYQTSGGAVAFNGDLTIASDLTVDTTGGGAGGANVRFGGALASSPASSFGATITAGSGTVTISGAATLAALHLNSAAGASALNAANQIGSLTAAVGAGGLSVRNAATLEVGSAGVSASGGNIDLRALSGDVVLDGTVSASGAGNLLLAATQGNFVNHVGATALSTATGRWLVYSTDPRLDTINGLVPQFKVYNAGVGSALPGGTVGEDGFVYLVAPVVTAQLSGTVEKVYDTTTAATLTAANYMVAAGAIDGDVVTLNAPLSGSYDTKNAGTGKMVTVNGVSIASVANGNITVYGYGIASSTVSGTVGIIDKANLIVAGLVALNKVYDGTNTATFSTSAAVPVGVLSGDHVGLVSATGTYDTGKNVGDNLPVTATTVQLSGADLGNYQLVPVTGLSASITPRPLNVTAVGADKTYDGTTTATISPTDNRVAGDALTVAWSANFLDANAGNNKYIAVNILGVTGNDAGNYTWNATASAFGTINKAPLTVAVTAGSRAYNGTMAASVTIGCALSDVVCATDAGSGGLTFSYTGATFADPNAGLHKPVIVSGVGLGGALSGNYTLTSSTATGYADISGLLLGLSGVTANNKVYDGTTTATLNLGGASLSGVLPGDSVGLGASGAGLFADPNAGLGKGVTATSIALTGSNAGNYLLDLSALTLSATITQATLTATVTAPDKVYDGSRTAAPTLTITGGLVGDQTLGVVSTGSFNSKDVATANLVTVDGVTLSDGANGGLASNYQLATGETTAAHITPATLTATMVAPDKVYDGSRTVATTLTITAGLVGTETVTAGAAATFNSKDVATADLVTVNAVTLGDGTNGGLAGNYQLAAGDTATAHITPATLVVVATGDDKHFDGTTLATVELGDNRVSGDQLTLGYGSANFADPNVGFGKPVAVDGIALEGGADASNYVLGNTSTVAHAAILPTDGIVPPPPVPPVFQPINPPTQPTPPVLDPTLPDGSGAGTGTGTGTGSGTGTGTGTGSGTGTGTGSGTGTGTGSGTGTGTGSGTGTGADAGAGAGGGDGTSAGAGAGADAGGGAATGTGGGAAVAGAAGEGAVARADVTPATVADTAEVRVTLLDPPAAATLGRVSVVVPAQRAAFVAALPGALYERVPAAGARASGLTLEGGGALPGWLRYDPRTRSLVAHGMPASALPLRTVLTVGVERTLVLISEASR